MMRKGSRRAVVVVALAALVAGCELALDFDRTKIDGGGIDASLGDVTLADQTNETGNEAATDAPPGDGGSDTGTDTGTDTGPKDTGSDTGNDAAADADDSG
jgi:hypothetical protein